MDLYTVGHISSRVVLFRGNIKEFFKDYCAEHNIEYDNFNHRED